MDSPLNVQKWNICHPQCLWVCTLQKLRACCLVWAWDCVFCVWKVFSFWLIPGNRVGRSVVGVTRTVTVFLNMPHYWWSWAKPNFGMASWVFKWEPSSPLSFMYGKSGLSKHLKLQPLSTWGKNYLCILKTSLCFGFDKVFRNISG